MSKIRNRFVASVLLVLVLAGSVAAQQLQRAIPEEVGLSSARLERISTVLTQYVEEQLPGVVALVARRGRVAYLEAFGHRDREAGAPQQVDDIFRIASQTKAIVSVAIMMLQEEGRLLISHPLGRYLPEFSETTVAVAHGDGDGGYDVVPARRAITIRDLLTHTSGIGYGGGPASERWASRSSRASRSTSADRSSGSTLMATSRSSLVSRARYTSPMPPAPSGSRIS